MGFVISNYLGKTCAMLGLNMSEPPEWIMSTPFKFYPAEECGICYTSFEDVEKICFFRCGHLVCPDCRDEVKTQGITNCHICRSRI